MQSLQDHFLIAMPAMADPNFNETVTYICKHDAEGAFGLVITRPSDLSLGEMLGQLAIDLKDRASRSGPSCTAAPSSPSAASSCTVPTSRSRRRSPSAPRSS